MKSANDIFREGCNLENYSPSLKVMNLAVWTATEYAAQKTKELTKENERLNGALNKIGNLIGNYMHNDSAKIGTLVSDIQEIVVKT